MQIGRPSVPLEGAGPWNRQKLLLIERDPAATGLDFAFLRKYSESIHLDIKTCRFIRRLIRAAIEDGPSSQWHTIPAAGHSRLNQNDAGPPAALTARGYWSGVR